jgi:general secretion pathway protein D
MRRAAPRRLSLLVLAAALLVSAAASAQKAPGPTGVELDVADTELPELVKTISALTGMRFVYGDRLRSIRATIQAPGKISAEEAYQAFLVVLGANGLTLVPRGRFFEIVESKGAAARAPIVGPAAPVPAEARVVTALRRLGQLDPASAAAVLDKLKSKDGDVTVHGDLLLLTDTGENIRRMLAVLGELDQPGSAPQAWLTEVHHGNASDLAKRLREALELDAPRAGGPRARLVADDRARSLVIVAAEPDYRRILALIDKLDVPPRGDGSIRPLPLQHAVCKDLLGTLDAVVGGRGAGVPGAAGAGLPDPFEGRIRLACDEATNALVATASPRDQGRLRALVDKLDRPRRQVFLELTIMDVTIDRSSALGTSYHAGANTSIAGSGQSLVYGGNDIATSIASVPANLEGLVLGIRGPDLSNTTNLFGTGLSIPSFGAVFSAVAKTGDANVLATPHLLATDNVKAEISIGQNIPLQTNVNGSLLSTLGQGASAGQSGQQASSGQRQDVGTKVTITPHVNDSDQVRLEVAEEISEAGAPLGSLGAVPIDKRTANTTLVVRDHQTVVIGGLVREEATTADTKIPLLGDIPLLGFLFKQTSKTRQRTNLMLVLTAHVIRDQDDLRAVFERKMQERQEMIDRALAFTEVRWAPPRDYRRTNGLLEDIRQSLLLEERKREAEPGDEPAKSAR